MRKIKTFLTSAKTKVSAFVTSAALVTSAAVYNVSAYTAPTVNTTDATNKARGIADILTYIFPLLGAFFAISGIIKWVMAFRSEQPEQQAAAAKEIVIGVVMIIFRAFLWAPIANVIF